MNRGAWRTLLARGIIFLCMAILLIEISNAELVVQPSDTTSTLRVTAYPIIFPNNFRNETITGELNKNARATIISASAGAVPGQASFILDGTSKDDLYLPAWHISFSDYTNLTTAIVQAQSINTTISVVLTPTGNNPWKRFNATAMVVFQAIIAAFSLSNLILCIWRVVGHIKADRCQRKLVRACLSLIFIGNLFRLVYFGVDPIWSRQVYPLVFQHLMLTFSHAFTLTVVILITFYWHDMIRGLSLDINQLLGRFKFIFIAVIVLLFVVELTMSILRSLVLFPLNIMLTVHATVYAATCFGFAVFFFVTAGRLLQTMRSKELPDRKQTRRKTLVRVTTIIVVIGICLLGQLAIFIIATNAALIFQPTQGAIWFCSYILLCVQDLLLILVMAPKVTRSSNSSVSKTSSKATTQMQTTTVTAQP